MSVSTRSNKEKAAQAAFFYVGHKKVGVPADLDLVSTIRRCEGWKSHPRAIRDDFEDNLKFVRSAPV